jgi:lysophospholipase
MAEGLSRSITTRDGLLLNVHVWDVPEPKGAVLLVHGLGEHGGRYAEVAEHLNGLGFRVVAPDHRGHGRSQGPRTDTPTFDHFLDDLELVENSLVDDIVPLAIWGHSLGGLITVRYLQRGRTRARVAVISAPWLGRPESATWWKLAPARVIGSLWPSAPMPSGVRGVMLTHDVEKQAQFDGDPLVSKTVSPRLYAEGTRAITRAFQEVERVRVEVLFLVPPSDVLVNPGETFRFVGLLPLERCAVMSQEEWRHEPHNEVGRASLLQDVGDWLGPKLNQ